ncbi:MAG: CBS domain-containing protein [Ignavibacteriae bacterium]|nr:CBS domain-containing protein [Ignavibacteriota bacterium]
MELFVVGLFVILSAICWFFAGAASGLSAVFLETYREIHPKFTRTLTASQQGTSSEAMALLALELLMVILSAIFMAVWGDSFGIWEISVVGGLILFAIILLLRTITFAAGKRFAEKVTKQTAVFLNVITTFFKPATLLLSAINRSIAPPPSEEESREEFDALVDTAREEGTLDDEEYRILKNIMGFSEVQVSDVMTPRTVVFSCDADKTVGEVVRLSELQMYSRFPICEGNSLDGVIGYVMTKDVLRAALNGQKNRMLRELMREVYFIPENVELGKALSQFLQRKQHLMMAVDEYGGIEGLITMEDVVEAILGVEIVDEADRIVNLRVLAKQRRDKRVAEVQAKGEFEDEMSDE